MESAGGGGGGLDLIFREGEVGSGLIVSKALPQLDLPINMPKHAAHYTTRSRSIRSRPTPSAMKELNISLQTQHFTHMGLTRRPNRSRPIQKNLTSKLDHVCRVIA